MQLHAALLALCAPLLAVWTSAFVVLPSRLPTSTSSALAAKKVTYKNFEDMLEKIEIPVLVDVYATWCGPCKLLSEQLGELAVNMKVIV